MKFGIKTRPEHVTYAQIRDLWVAADEIDLFETAWNWDHFYPLTGDLDGPNLEAWTSLAALAQATSRIRVGIQVAALLYHHPAVIANMAATIDHVSEGRLELGLGAGWNQMECDAYGIPLPPLKERFDLFDEGLEIIVGLLTQDWTDFAGQHYTITHARCEPKPIQRPHPPITIGGTGPKRTLRATARWAQQWNAITPSVEEWQRLKGVLAEHCATIGRDPAEIECSVNVMVPVDGDLGPALERVTEYREAGADIVIMNLPHGAPASSLEPLAESLRDLA